MPPGPACLALLLGTALAARPASAQAPGTSGEGTGDPTASRVALSSLGPKERVVLDRYLEAPDWPVGVFGLLRLERYEGEEVAAILKRDAAGAAWPLRCFAIRQAQRCGVPLTAANLPPDEDDPRVIRAALRHGVALDDALVQRTGNRLLRTREIDALLLGIDIASASNVEHLRREAGKRAAALIGDMDGALEAVVSRRLAASLGVQPVPKSVSEWLAWLAARDGRVDLPAPRPGPGPPARGLVANLDAETFARLLDYLDVLRTRDLDMALVMDSTASMVPMINEARAGADSLILFFNDISRDMRLGIVAYRDHNNPPVCEGQRLTTDIDAVRKFLFGIRITGGPDLPEAVLDGLAACRGLGWNESADRQIILIGDARPHDGDLAATQELAGAFAAKGVRVHAVHVPMRVAPDLERYLTPDRAEEIERHNALTVAAFADIAESGGGRMVTLSDASDLVPAVLHAALEEGWWPVFDEFYDLYLALCR